MKAIMTFLRGKRCIERQKDHFKGREVKRSKGGTLALIFNIIFSKVNRMFRLTSIYLLANQFKVVKNKYYPEKKLSKTTTKTIPEPKFQHRAIQSTCMSNLTKFNIDIQYSVSRVRLIYCSHYGKKRQTKSDKIIL